MSVSVMQKATLLGSLHIIRSAPEGGGVYFPLAGWFAYVDSKGADDEPYKPVYTMTTRPLSAARFQLFNLCI